MFVTCFYGVLDPESATLRYANAGHDLPYLWHGGAAEELRARGMPLGLMPEMSYEQKEITLEPGESVLLYSDGLVEAHDPQGEMFGFPRLRALVAEYGEERSLGEALLEELYSFVGEGWEQEDDITLLTLRRYSALSRTSENPIKAKFAEITLLRTRLNKGLKLDEASLTTLLRRDTLGPIKKVPESALHLC
jgi:hypothetical protein